MFLNERVVPICYVDPLPFIQEHNGIYDQFLVESRCIGINLHDSLSTTYTDTGFLCIVLQGHSKCTCYEKISYFSQFGKSENKAKWKCHVPIIYCTKLSCLEYELHLLILENGLAKNLLLSYCGQARCCRDCEVRDKWFFSLFNKRYSQKEKK